MFRAIFTKKWLSATDRRGIRTSFAWDRENRLLSTTRSGITLESNQYDGNGNRIFTTDARGHTTGYEYDERNLLKAENRPLAAITRFVLDDVGDRIRRTDPEGRVTEWSYDLRRRQLREKRLMDPGNSSDDEDQASCYDGNGNRIARFEPEAFAALGSTEPCESPYPGGFVYGFDGANRLTSVRDPLENLTSYGYDPSGNRTSQTDDNLHTTTFEYDELERLTKKIYPEVGGVAAEESYGYDANGNRTSLTDPLGQVFSWQYDALDRETLATYPPPTPPRGDDLQSIATAYDGNGNVETVTETYSGPSGSRTTTQTWDAFDRLQTKTDPEGELLTYGYDAAGNRNRLTDPDGRTTLYQHDALNRLQSVLPPGTGATLYEYFGNSLLKKITYPNGATATYAYDRANRVTSIDNRQNTALVSSYVYAYDRNSNRTSQEETNGGAAETTTYVYDGADRLEEVHYPDETVVYTLDGVGNRQTAVTTDTDTGTITSNKTYGYNERDFLLSVTDSVEPANNTTYAYDVNGNQVEKTAVQSGVISNFIYDVRDQLVEVSTSTGLLETYGYSYDGLRTRKSGPGGLFRFVYDERSLLLQTDLAGLTIAKYEWGPDRLLSLDHATEGRQFYLFDGLGSVASLSKPDGTLQARFRWDAWGNLRSQAGDSFNLFGFTGHQRDEETGLYYAQARFYDPEIGRFLNEDPFGGALDLPPSLHRYVYAHGNPLFYVDPDGRAACELPESLCTPEVRVDPNTGQLSTTGPGSAPSTVPSEPTEERPIINRAINWVRGTRAGQLLGWAEEKKEEAIAAVGALAEGAVRGVMAEGRELTAEELQLVSALDVDPKLVNRVGELQAGIADVAADLTREGTEAGARALINYGQARVGEAALGVVSARRPGTHDRKSERSNGVVQESAESPGVEIDVGDGPEAGVIYLRTDPRTGDSYVGQSKSPSRFDARQGEHDRNLGVEHEFEVLGRATPGPELDVLEETLIRERGGIQKEGGTLANRRHQMREKRYRESGGTADNPRR